MYILCVFVVPWMNCSFTVTIARLVTIDEDEITPPGFTIDAEITVQYRRFSAVGTELTVRLLPLDDDANPTSNFLASVNDLFEYLTKL
jgi:hypothetical protein